ncbi:MAG: DNA cytosine methyltransferase [Betaproteobacteria bacterium]|nr:DNA cytosine methyltransferase [Betaproteobacteria bacterium]
MPEIIVDSFAGGGGASTGIEWALGRSPDIAINHSPAAIAMHRLNHPRTKHYCENVWKVDPLEATGGRPVGLAWFSPDCTHFSKAKGGKPRSKKIRGLAWVVYHWAKAVRPRVIVLENVEEFATWGPLLSDGKPDPARAGFTFRRWWRQIENLGYQVDARELRACDFGAPTTRKRLFVIARCDGHPIQWPEPTHGPGLQPYRPAAECIDWSIECPSIFGRKRPLADATLRRIARGVMRYVVHARQPFLVVTLRGTEDSHIAASARSAAEPLRTVTAQGSQGGLVAAFLAKHYGGHEGPGTPLQLPLDTVTARDHHSLVHAFLLKYYGTDQDPRLEDPLHTITGKDRFGLVTVQGERYRIADIGMRMLQPRELYRAQGFPENVKLLGSKSSQVELCGNSVCPPLAAAIVRANMVEAAQEQVA